MSNLLKFRCPSCGGDQIECVQVEAVVQQIVTADADTGEVHYGGEPEIGGDDIRVDHFQCPFCGYVLPDVDGEDKLAPYLRTQACNIHRDPGDIRRISEALANMFKAWTHVNDLRVPPTPHNIRSMIMSPETLELKKSLIEFLELVGGCDQIINELKD